MSGKEGGSGEKNASARRYCKIDPYPHDDHIGTQIQPQKVSLYKVIFGKEPEFKHKR